MKFDFKFNNTEKFNKFYNNFYKSISNRVEVELTKSAMTIQKNAKGTIIRNNNIITGQLLRSVTGDVVTKRKYSVKANFTLRAYSRVFYAVYVERLYPYLFPAFENERAKLMKRLIKIAKG